MLSSAQLKAARALLDWDQPRLAEVSGVSLATVRRMEQSEDHVRANVDTLVKIMDALKRGGVELIEDGAASSEGGRGVRLRR